MADDAQTAGDLAVEDLEGLPPQVLVALGATGTDERGSAVSGLGSGGPDVGSRVSGLGSGGTDDGVDSPVEKPALESDGGAATIDVTPVAPGWSDALGAANRDEVRRHPVVAAIVGELVGKARTDLRRELQQELADQASQAQLDQIALSDRGHPLAQRHLAQREEERRMALLNAVQTQTLDLPLRAIKSFVDELPDSERAAYDSAIRQKSYDGDWHDGYKSFLRDVVDTVTQTRLNAAKTDWESRERDALRKEVLAELNGGEPSPRVSSGASSAAGRYRNLSVRELETMPVEEFQAHEGEILAGLFGGA